MSEEALVSVLIPCRDSARWLREALESCLGQTHANLEVVFVDDGSNDGSFELAQQVAQHDTRLRVYRQPPSGACRARNRAFELSRGQYIQYLDADDFLRPDKVERQLDLLRRTGAPVAVGPWVALTEEHGQARLSDPVLTPMAHVEDPVRWLQLKFLLGGMNIPACWLTERQTVERAGPWNEGLRADQDGEFLTRLLLAAGRVVFSPDAVSVYRRSNPQSITRSPSPEKWESRLRALELCEGHLRTADDSRDTRSALAAAYRRFIYKTHPQNPDLLKRAWLRIEQLAPVAKTPIGPRRFRRVAAVLGFRRTLELRAWIEKRGLRRG